MDAVFLLPITQVKCSLLETEWEHREIPVQYIPVRCRTVINSNVGGVGVLYIKPVSQYKYQYSLLKSRYIVILQVTGVVLKLSYPYLCSMCPVEHWPSKYSMEHWPSKYSMEHWPSRYSMEHWPSKYSMEDLLWFHIWDCSQENLLLWKAGLGQPED